MVIVVDCGGPEKCDGKSLLRPTRNRSNAPAKLVLLKFSVGEN